MSDYGLSLEEISSYLGVSKDTIYGWITKREVPAQSWKALEIQIR